MTSPPSGYQSHTMLRLLQALHLRSAHLQLLSTGSVGLCITLWIRAKTVDQEERGNAERRALFVGLWAPTLWVMGESLHQAEQGSCHDSGGARRTPRR